MFSFDELHIMYKRLLPYDSRIMRGSMRDYWESIRHVVEDRPPITNASLQYITDCARVLCSVYCC